jgi:hypothetical protein
MAAAQTLDQALNQLRKVSGLLQSLSLSELETVGKDLQELNKKLAENAQELFDVEEYEKRQSPFYIRAELDKFRKALAGKITVVGPPLPFLS